MAAKLDQVPVPDMADSIWSAINMQLDAAPDVPKKKTVKFKGKSWYGFLGTVTVVTVLWWGYKHMNHTPHTPQNKPTQKIAPVTKDSSVAADSNTIINAVKKRNVPVKPVSVKKDSISLQNVPMSSPVIDSAIKIDLPPVHIDSSLFHINSVPLPHSDSATNKPQGKKRKGVKVNNDDYKISANKDSGG
jgi:cytoskeletal protein RodZ